MDSVAIWAERLHNPDRKVRQQAIRSLEVLGEPDALPLLAEVYASDADSELRELAQWAGKSIYYNLHRQQQKTVGASEAERKRAAQILAKAHARKQRNR